VAKRGVCPVCKKNVAVKDDGTAYLHGRDNGSGGCAGSGQPTEIVERKRTQRSDRRTKWDH